MPLYAFLSANELRASPSYDRAMDAVNRGLVGCEKGPAVMAMLDLIAHAVKRSPKQFYEPVARAIVAELIGLFPDVDWTAPDDH